MKYHKKYYFFSVNFFITCLNAYIYSHDMATYDFLDHQNESLNHEFFYSSNPKNNDSSLLPLCFAAHIIEKISYLVTGYIIISSGFDLQERLDSINTYYYWPFSWFAKFGSYGSCGLTIGTALAKVLLIRYGTKLLINTTCPKELCKKSIKLQPLYQTEQEKIKNI